MALLCEMDEGQRLKSPYIQARQGGLVWTEEKHCY